MYHGHYLLAQMEYYKSKTLDKMVMVIFFNNIKVTSGSNGKLSKCLIYICIGIYVSRQI